MATLNLWSYKAITLQLNITFIDTICHGSVKFQNEFIWTGSYSHTIMKCINLQINSSLKITNILTKNKLSVTFLHVSNIFNFMINVSII